MPLLILRPSQTPPKIKIKVDNAGSWNLQEECATKMKIRQLNLEEEDFHGNVD